MSEEPTPMRMNLYLFHPDGGPDFEVWAPRGMRQIEAPNVAGALVADEVDGFAPNLVVGFDRISGETTLEALIARLQHDVVAQPGARLQAERTVPGTAGDVVVIAFTRDGVQGSGPLYQTTACLLAPTADRGDEADSLDERADSDERLADAAERDLIYLTGTCTVEQMPAWDPAFVSAASTVRFG
jgi:hypothetical protein